MTRREVIARFAARPRVRSIATWLGVVALVVVARWRWAQLTNGLVPYVDYDTQIFTQVADLPFGWDLLGASKPLLVPLLYRAAHADAATIVAVQANFAFIAWTLFTASLVLGLRRRWVRVLAIVVGAAFLFAPTRVGFTASLLSESIGDSLTALIAAGAIALLRVRGRPRIAIAIATGACAIAWFAVRDTNVFIALPAVALAMIVGRGWRSRRAWAGTCVIVVVAVGVLWTTGREHAPLPYQADWNVHLTPRRMYPLVDNVISRASSEVPSELLALAEPRDAVWLLFAARPEIRPLQDWIVDHGSAAYTHWLVRHPVDRMGEMFAARWIVLAGSNSNYMPGGWDGRGIVLDRATRNHWLLGILCLLAPVLLWRPHADRLRALALCMIASGLVGAAAAYFGDAAESLRHCYGAGQQIVLGLFIALVARLDRLERLVH